MFGSTLLLGHVAYVLEYDLTVRKAYAITEHNKKNSRKSLEHIFDIFKDSLVYRLFSIEKEKSEIAEVLKKLANAVMRGCVEDEDALDKLSGGMKKTTPGELSALQTRLDASPKELAKSAASIMNTLLASVWALKEANVALSSFKSSQQGESLSPLGASVSAREQEFARFDRRKCI